MVHAELFERNTNVPAEVFDFVESLPSITTPDKLASPLRRAKALAQLLTDDSKGPALLPDAREHLARALNGRLDGLAAEHRDAVAGRAEDIRSGQWLVTPRLVDAARDREWTCRVGNTAAAPGASLAETAERTGSGEAKSQARVPL